MFAQAMPVVRPSFEHKTTDDAELLSLLPMVRAVARRVARCHPSGLEVEELVNVGVIGLVDALSRYDRTRGVPVQAYAEVRVRGAMVDAIRQNDWVPASVRRKVRGLDRARADLRARLGREPSRGELAADLRLDAQRFDRLEAAVAPQRIVPLDAPTGSDGEAHLSEYVADSTPSILEDWLQEEEQEAVRAAIADLPEDERTVLRLCFGPELKYKEIGARLGVSESRVCQLRQRALERLRKRLAAEDRTPVRADHAWRRPRAIPFRACSAS